jgi:hypothetical protein
MDKYNNEFEACDKLKLKPGFGEFYGGNQVHITRQNDKQLEKQKYKPFKGAGNLLNIKPSSNTQPPKLQASKIYSKKKSYSSINHYNRVDESIDNILTAHEKLAILFAPIKKPITNYTNINDCNGLKIKKPYDKQKNKNFTEINISKPDNTSKLDSKNSENDFYIFILFISFFYLCYLLHLANQKLYYYTGYKLSL